ncbi:Fructosamine kinase-domain-containing protein [Cladorrhinum sp. PSN332]|nr:Fructosamine kinase-domain-containing protein [Cladorrhinum sp. PSN332]
MALQWEVPPKFLGKIPAVSPGSSGGKVVEGDFPLDQVVIEKFPPGSVIHSCHRYGGSEWTVSAKIEATLADGETKSYFLKCAEYDQGRVMLEGEFDSINEMYKVSPNLVPQPHAWGQLSVSEPKTYYFLCDFIELKTEDPDPVRLCEKLVALHKSSVSPSGMFGFHLQPLRGNVPLETTWNPSWSDFFSQLFGTTMVLEEKINGKWKNMRELVEMTIAHVVPKVLGPLESGGRSVKPSLIHGDLWIGNIGTDCKTGEIYIFDASSYYAHHEMEIAIWRPLPNNLLGSGVYVKEYLAQMGASEPAEQFEDRQKLYSACTALHAAACHDGEHFREETHEKLQYLLNQYAPHLKGTTT